MSGGQDDGYPVLEDLGLQLRSAAVEQAAARRAASIRRRRQRTTGVALIAAFGVAGAAGAAQLIGIGAPVDDRRDVAPVLRPAAGGTRTIAVTVADPAGGPSWAVAAYTGTDKRPCAVAGRSRAGRLGEQASVDVFRPYPPNFAGSCGTLGDRTLIYNVTRPKDTALRTLVYGRAGRDVPRVRVTAEGRRFTVPTGPQGAFLLVFTGALVSRDVAVRPLAAG